MPKKLFLCSAVGGCESNAHRGSAIVRHFEANGWEVVAEPGAADCVVVTTCGAAASLARKCVDLVTSLRDRVAVSTEIIVTGCLPRMPEHGLDGLGVTVVKDLSELNARASLAGDLAEVEPEGLDEGLYAYPFVGSGYRHVRVASGCLGTCSYCSVKFAIGGLSSRPREAIVADVRAGHAAGTRRFFLFGDDCASYGADIGTDLPTLLRDLLAVDAGLHVAINYLEPQWLLKIWPRLREVLADLALDYACVPLQSGSDRLLELMRRRYAVADVLAVVADLKRLSPATEVHTNLLVGFPTEDDADFRASLEAARAFDRAHFVQYSERPGTRSVRLTPKVPPDVVQARYRLLAEQGDPERFVAKSESGRDETPLEGYRSLMVASASPQAEPLEGFAPDDRARLAPLLAWLRAKGVHPRLGPGTVELRWRDPARPGVLTRLTIAAADGSRAGYLRLGGLVVSHAYDGALTPRTQKLYEVIERYLSPAGR